MNLIDADLATQVKHILGKPVSSYGTTKYGADDTFLVGQSGQHRFSEFHFGAGESSIIRMIAKIEAAPKNSLILIEEIENGLHPIATKRMVEYLIEVAQRKSIQTIFTTHSDYALEPLPSEAIWAAIAGNIKQGKLSVEALRAVSGRIDKKLAIFVEDEFAKAWVDCILRDTLRSDYDQVEVHAVSGDGNAVATHKSHIKNPATRLKSLCVIDGDSEQSEDATNGVIRLPGKQPELAVYQSLLDNLDRDLPMLTVMCQRPYETQLAVKAIVQEVAHTTRDPHLLFNKVGLQLGWIAEPTVRGAFLTLWVRENTSFCETLAAAVRSRIDAQPAIAITSPLQVTLPPLSPAPPLALSINLQLPLSPP